MGGDNLAVLGGSMGENVLDEVVAVLIAGDVDQGNPRTVDPALADAVQVAAQKLGAANLQTLLNNLGGELVHAVLSSIADDMVDGPATVRRSAVLADVLDAPVAKLAVGDNVDIGQDFLDARTLQPTSQQPSR
jgi:hypothetical protein